MLSDPETIISEQLSPDERLIWAGRPLGGLRLRPSDWFLIPFSLMWCGFAIFWESMVILKNAPFFFALWGIPFVLVGLYMVIGRFFADAYARGRTYYGVTNERVLIIGGLFGRQIKSLQLQNLSDVSLTERADRVGTITFGASWMNPFQNQMQGFNRNVIPSFDFIPDARDVFRIVQSAQKQVRTAVG